MTVAAPIGQAIGRPIGRAIGAGAAGAWTANFLAGEFPLGITFTRASSATKFDKATPPPTTVGSNVARFEVNPFTLQPRGLLIEGARTNLFLNSATLVTQDVTVTAAPHTLSFYGTGSVTLSGAAVGTLNGTGVYPNRAQLTFIPTAGTLTFTVTGSVTFAQVELGDFATSWIPTTGASATRALDNAAINTLSTIGFNPNEGTIILKAQLVSISNNFARLLTLSDGTAANAIEINETTGTWRFNVFTGGVNQVALNASAVTTGVTKFAIAYKANDCAFCVNGGAVATDTSCTIPSVDRLVLGYLIGANSFAWYRGLTYIPRRLTDAEMQAITT